jgi:hypothetical protein
MTANEASDLGRRTIRFLHVTRRAVTTFETGSPSFADVAFSRVLRRATAVIDFRVLDGLLDELHAATRDGDQKFRADNGWHSLEHWRRQLEDFAAGHAGYRQFSQREHERRRA